MKLFSFEKLSDLAEKLLVVMAKKRQEKQVSCLKYLLLCCIVMNGVCTTVTVLMLKQHNKNLQICCSICSISYLYWCALKFVFSAGTVKTKAL